MHQNIEAVTHIRHIRRDRHNLENLILSFRFAGREMLLDCSTVSRAQLFLPASGHATPTGAGTPTLRSLSCSRYRRGCWKLIPSDNACRKPQWRFPLSRLRQMARSCAKKLSGDGPRNDREERYLAPGLLAGQPSQLFALSAPGSPSLCSCGGRRSCLHTTTTRQRRDGNYGACRETTTHREASSSGYRSLV